MYRQILLPIKTLKGDLATNNQVQWLSLLSTNMIQSINTGYPKAELSG